MGFGLGDVFKTPKKLYDTFESMISPKKPEYPDIPEPTVMPTANDDEQRKARRRAIAAQMARSGRASTIMSDKETLG